MPPEKTDRLISHFGQRRAPLSARLGPPSWQICACRLRDKFRNYDPTELAAIEAADVAEFYEPTQSAERIAE